MDNNVALMPGANVFPSKSSLQPVLQKEDLQQGSPGRRSSIGSTKQYYANGNRTPLSTSQSTTAPNSPPAAGSLPTRTPNVDGMEFFLQARNRLSYEQFSAFMANIRELNAHRRTREETLRAADEIFGPENNDLYKSFENLQSRHVSAYFRQ
ncbi:hypothetical protein O6H91_06G047000 [Diphasiastrum complanatum]|uniref:Uncharacterized protein n=1 Tax=Diphasiastrum complanatum TaxID=34168 RepID=A0ACC2DDB4_DIPCM|nr:hypothetical protein O6H91_06G047000 [Diphasiastrum complanatum]